MLIGSVSITGGHYTSKGIEMQKFIPCEKLSQKEKRKMDMVKPQVWRKLNPVTRKHENSRTLNHKKAQNRKKDVPSSARSA